MGEMINVEYLKVQPAIVKRKSVKVEEIEKELRSTFKKLHAFLKGKGVKVSGPPFARFYEITPDEADMEAGLPVEGKVETGDNFEYKKLPKGVAAGTWHVGTRDGIKKTYERLEKWLFKNHHKPVDIPWEVYWTDQNASGNEDQVRTQVFWPFN